MNLERTTNLPATRVFTLTSLHQQTDEDIRMNTQTQHLVIGSTGKTGTRVLKGLKALGFAPKGASRNGDVTFDWDDQTTWATALNSIDAVYLTYYPDLAVPKAPEHISKFCALANI